MSDGATQAAANRLVYVGTHRVTGRAKGTYCSVVQPERVSVNVGVDGEGSFVDNSDESATITIVLQPSSRSNLVLSGIFDTGLAVPVSVVEKNGTTAGSCVRARITKKADVAWTSEGSEVRTWTLVTTKWTGVVGDIAAMDLAEVDEAAL